MRPTTSSDGRCFSGKLADCRESASRDRPNESPYRHPRRRSSRCSSAAASQRPRSLRPASPRPTASPRTRSSSSSTAKRAAGPSTFPAGRGAARPPAPCARTRGSPTPRPNYIATASRAAPSTEIPNDPGALDAFPSSAAGGWVSKQWNFLPWEGPSTPQPPTSRGGIDAIGAWRHLTAAGRPGARGSGSPSSTPGSPTATRASASAAAPTSPQASS